MEKHDQLDVDDFNNQMLRDLGFGELVEDMNTSTSNTCGSCERKFCICFVDTSSEVTIASEDSLKNSRHSASYETETEVEVEQRMEQRAARPGLGRAASGTQCWAAGGAASWAVAGDWPNSR